MGNLFSKKKVSRVTEQDRAVLDLKKQRDQLNIYKQKIVATLEKERALAKQLLISGRKDRAKLLLKKKRFQENLLDKTDSQLDNLEKMVNDLEFAQIEIKVIEGLKEGNEALKKVHAALSIEDIEKILEETREGIEKQSEIDAILSNKLSPEDLEEVETELEKIIAEENLKLPKEQLSPTDSEMASLPEVPETPLPELQDHELSPKRKERVAVAAT